MLETHQDEILVRTGANAIDRFETIQELWSGYGAIVRVSLSGGVFSSVILKHIVEPSVSNHPRGWDTQISNKRKIRSYEVEVSWYRSYSERCDDACRIPKMIDFWEEKDEKFILMEDLNSAGFPFRKSNLSMEQIAGCLRWLANFHATFLNTQPKNLWEIGTYWNLGTRPDEFNQMEESELKNAATRIDAELNASKFVTLVHGDAKVANFCFGSAWDEVAAVDFQYVGGGCGIKDVAYFLGSVLGEEELELLEEVLLKKYFEFLRESLSEREVDFTSLEIEWRGLYPLVWADFTRFLLGWMPTHQKLNRYSEKMVDIALGLK